MKILYQVICLMTIIGCTGSDKYTFLSPDEQVKISLSNRTDQLSFSLLVEGDTLINESPLGLELEGNILNITLSDLKSDSFDETWRTINGKNSEVRNHYNEYKLKVSESGLPEKGYYLTFRIYNDGAAYRYEFPQEFNGDSIKMKREITHLNFSGNFTYWAYNGEHHPVGPIISSDAQPAELSTPIVLKFDANRYAAIHEAAIMEFAPFSLQTQGLTNILGFHVNYLAKKNEFKTSWRAIILGENPGDLLESNLLVNLNEPCKIEDPFWIKPGKSLWDWRVWGYQAPDGFEYGLNTESHKRFIDFAAGNNIQYLLIDADWYGSEFSELSNPTSAREGIDIEECMAYAWEKKVGIILYLNDVGAKKFGLERVLKQFSNWGAVGVKYGFMQGTEEEKVLHTREVVALCAKYKLMVNFHDGPIPPSGDRRTWPNLITREFGHAQADARRSYFPETAVNTALVNMIAGPLDMTNGWFDLNQAHSRNKVFEEIPGTLAAEVAKLIVYYTGWMVLPDAPEAYLKYEDMFECIRQMPARFDSFHVLDAEMDEFIIVARQAGDDWFIGALTNREPRELEIEMDFLTPGTEYLATIYKDASATHFQNNKESYQIEQITRINSKSIIKSRLASGGGQAIHLIKQ